MDPVWGRVAVVVNLLAYILIRWPHGNRLKTLEVHESRCGCPEALRLSWATLGTTVLPLLWALSGMLNFADYALHPVVFAIGNASSLIGHWLFFRSHRDLGTYWSPTLQVRENHQLITSGIYTRIRHPMYAAMMM
ncbi:MAG: isoprenylcysteine carboxylmethyltransferase family protein, partial [Pirellulaceae bacterium]|nr:isoprenylcysteine carboxylmethyltransferase family protein [Pirellulaceae bacterium]